MSIEEKDIKRFSAIIILALLAILAFIVVKRILLSIFAGLLLAYIFSPLYKKILKVVKKKNLAASIVSIFITLLIFIPLWFLIPVVVKQLLNLAKYSQDIDTREIIVKLLPAASEQTITQINLALTSAIAKMNAFFLNSLVDILVNFAFFLLDLLIVAFVFYFTMRDSDKLKEFFSGLSPLNKNQERILISQFESITKSLIYGQFIIGLLQGIFVGLGFLIFKIPNALLLTILAVILGILPVLGPTLIYIPVTLFLLITGDPIIAILYFLYNALILAYLDQILRVQLVSRKTSLPQALVLVGMIGGVFAFGVLGLILGPLILIYFVHFLKAYKDKNLSSMFSQE